MKYAIFGASGAVGKPLAAELAAAGKNFRVVGRSEEKLRREFSLHEPFVDYCAADLSNPHDAARAAAAADTVFYLVGVPYPQFSLHPKLTRIALEAAIASGVKRFVLLGTIYPFGRPQTPLVNEDHPRDPHTFKGRMRKEQEDIVLAADGRNGLRTTVVRAPDFFGPDSELSFVYEIFKAAVHGGAANVIGPIDTPHEFIYVPDVARILAALSEKEEAYGRAWNLAGPAMVTTRRFADLAFAAVGKKPRLRVAGKTMLRIAGLFSPILRETVEMHYLWTTPIHLDDARIRQLLPNLSRTPYETAIPATIAAMQNRANAR
jgi:nucleoside-diphosphate-sugar epimerase